MIEKENSLKIINLVAIATNSTLLKAKNIILQFYIVHSAVYILVLVLSDQQKFSEKSETL